MSPLYHSRVHRTFPNIHGIRQRDQLADRQRVGLGDVGVIAHRKEIAILAALWEYSWSWMAAEALIGLGFGQANKMLKQQRPIELAAFLDGERPCAAGLLKLAHTTLKLG